MGSSLSYRTYALSASHYKAEAGNGHSSCMLSRICSLGGAMMLLLGIVAGLRAHRRRRSAGLIVLCLAAAAANAEPMKTQQDHAGIEATAKALLEDKMRDGKATFKKE